MDVSDISSKPTFSDSDECDEHNIWNSVLELLCHAHIDVFMEALFDEKYFLGEWHFLVFSHQTPDTTKNELVLLLSQACQARLGMTKRVRKRSITSDDSQPSEVARQAGIRLFTIRIDHFVHDDHVCNFLLDDLVIDSGGEPDVKNVARGPDQPCSPDCSTHAMVGDSRRIFPRSVLQTDTIIVSCGLPNFERTSWSTAMLQMLVNARRTGYSGRPRQVSRTFRGKLPWSERQPFSMDDRLQKADCDKNPRIHIGRIRGS